MNLLNFIEMFPRERECILYFKNIREHAGVECHNCGGTHHLWIDNINQFKCVRCETMIHIKTGTALENSALPIKYWFLAAHMLTCDDMTYTVNDICRKMDYLSTREVKEMLATLESIMNCTIYTRNFNVLLYASAKSFQGAH